MSLSFSFFPRLGLIGFVCLFTGTKYGTETDQDREIETMVDAEESRALD